MRASEAAAANRGNWIGLGRAPRGFERLGMKSRGMYHIKPCRIVAIHAHA
jgi:hypothetical protein